MLPVSAAASRFVVVPNPVVATGALQRVPNELYEAVEAAKKSVKRPT